MLFIISKRFDLLNVRRNNIKEANNTNLMCLSQKPLN
jgi:hypothetical protein